MILDSMKSEGYYFHRGQEIWANFEGRIFRAVLPGHRRNQLPLGHWQKTKQIGHVGAVIEAVMCRARKQKIQCNRRKTTPGATLSTSVANYQTEPNHLRTRVVQRLSKRRIPVQEPKTGILNTCEHHPEDASLYIHLDHSTGVTGRHLVPTWRRFAQKQAEKIHKGERDTETKEGMGKGKSEIKGGGRGNDNEATHTSMRFQGHPVLAIERIKK